MPRAQADKAYVNFIAGLITEANPLAFPEGAAADLDNVLLNTDGSIRRRYGIDFETEYISRGLGDQDYASYIALTAHRWRSAGGNGNLDFTVIQVGDRLDIYDTNAEVLSKTRLASVDISSAALNAFKGKSTKLSSAYGKGRLFMCGKGYNPFYVEYDQDSNTYSIVTTEIEIRDFDRIDDGLSIEEKPATLSKEHKYNLLNQGWLTEHIDAYKTSKSVYPSNAQIWHVSKNTSDNFDPVKLDKISFGNTAAPNGHFILKAFFRDKSKVSGVSGFSVEAESNRPETVAFFAGRVWYAGIDSKKLNGHILFSQILEDLEMGNAGKCYQEQDPTAEEFNDLLDTDGGAIIIPEAGQIHKLVPIDQSMLVVARNGAWIISGTDGGFTASKYSSNKVSEFGSVSQSSVIQAEGTVLYWADGGIYAVGVNPDTLNTYSAQDIARLSIKSFYADIPKLAKESMSSFYDSVGKRAYWLYNDDPNYTGVLYQHNYNKALILDLSTPRPAFTKVSYPYEEGVIPGIAAFLYHKNDNITKDSIDVEVNGNSVEVMGDQVIVAPLLDSEPIDSVHALVLYKDNTNMYKYTFAHHKDRGFVDWTTNGNSVDFVSYIQTGFEVLGDLMRNKSATFVYSYFKKTERSYTGDASSPVYDFPSGCTLQAKWAWSNNAVADKWTTPQQVYNLGNGYKALYSPDDSDVIADGFDIIHTRRKLRGQGKAVALLYKSVSGKDFILYGWSIPYTATGNVM